MSEAAAAVNVARGDRVGGGFASGGGEDGTTEATETYLIPTKDLFICEIKRPANPVRCGGLVVRIQDRGFTSLALGGHDHDEPFESTLSAGGFQIMNDTQNLPMTPVFEVPCNALGVLAGVGVVFTFHNTYADRVAQPGDMLILYWRQDGVIRFTDDIEDGLTTGYPCQVQILDWPLVAAASCQI